jgi:hypothetical protein
VIEDAQIGCILTQQRLKDRLPATSGVSVICVDADWETFALATNRLGSV